MSQLLIGTILAGVSLFASAAHSHADDEKETTANYKQLKPMEWAAGTWRREWTADESTSNAKKGDKLAKEWRFAWTANKNAILITQMMTAAGKTTGQLDALFGWNGKEIAGSGFGTRGLSGGGWTIETGEATFTISAGASDWVFKKKGKDKLSVTDAKGGTQEYRLVPTKK